MSHLSRRYGVMYEESGVSAYPWIWLQVRLKPKHNQTQKFGSDLRFVSLDEACVSDLRPEKEFELCNIH